MPLTDLPSSRYEAAENPKPVRTYNVRLFQACSLCALAFSLAACGEANTNDFQPTDNVLRRGSDGADDDELRHLRALGRPASIEQAQAADTGLLIRVENALLWADGARGAKTMVHLNVRLCGEKSVHKPGKGSDDKVEMTHCHELVGTVNQGEHEYFYLTPVEALAVVKDNDNGYTATMQYKLTAQTTATWYSGGAIALEETLDAGKQSVEVEVVEARPTSYQVRVKSSFVKRGSPVL